MATTFWQAFFSELWISKVLNQRSLVFLTKFYIFRSFPCKFIDFDHFLFNFGGFWRFLENLRNPRWPPFENKTLLWRHITSSAEVGFLNGNVFGRSICPLSFVVIALILSESAPPRSHKTKKSPVWIGLIAVCQNCFSSKIHNISCIWGKRINYLSDKTRQNWKKKTQWKRVSKSTSC